MGFVWLWLLALAAPASAIFPCRMPPAGSIPTAPARNISLVQPAHVSLVMAFGDSITAAFAARSTPYEARDQSWAIGSGSADSLTVPFMLGQCREAAGGAPKLEGMSTKSVLPKDIAHMPHNDYHPGTDHMNFAESEGAVHRGSLVEQWGFAQTQFSKYAAFADRWKVLTLWMTANDVCGECKASSAADGRLKEWTAGVNQFLGNVTSAMGKVYVNLIGTFPLSNVSRVQRANLECAIEHKIIDECGCVDRGNASELALMDANTLLFNAALETAADSWNARIRAAGRADVAVVYHDFMTGEIGGELTRADLSGLDCFHPSSKAHQSLAIGLWDSMVCTGTRTATTLCGKRPTINDPVPLCPTANSTLYIPPSWF